MASMVRGSRVLVVSLAITAFAVAGCSQGSTSSEAASGVASLPEMVESNSSTPGTPSPAEPRTVTPTPFPTSEVTKCFYGSEADEWILVTGSKCSTGLSKKPKKAKPTPKPSPTPTLTEPEVETENCTPGYSPCLPPAYDYDCAGGSGNGPAYTGRVEVTGPDIYDLDRDGDGVGCE